MSHGVDGGKARGHEQGGRHERAPRPARQAADTMTTGAARGEARADAHQQARHDQARGAGLDGNWRQRGTQLVQPGRRAQAQQERHTPQAVALRRQQTAQDAADTRDAPRAGHQQHGGGADQQAACGGRRRLQTG
ncbi:hypothetical protein G6F35_016457 [Rhizopus arrhizus]|nr:hypothetical protein G6F35_016457 [Rhizopus arrhizus]